MPDNLPSILKFDVVKQNWKVIKGDNLKGCWNDPVLAADGCIYATPSDDKIPKIDPSNDSVVLIPNEVWIVWYLSPV